MHSSYVLQLFFMWIYFLFKCNQIILCFYTQVAPNAGLESQFGRHVHTLFWKEKWRKYCTSILFLTSKFFNILHIRQTRYIYCYTEYIVVLQDVSSWTGLRWNSYSTTLYLIAEYKVLLKNKLLPLFRLYIILNVKLHNAVVRHR